MTPAVTDPFALTATVTAPNRLQLAPMTTCLSSSDGSISDTEIEWYKSRGASGFGTVVTGGFSVRPDGQIRQHQARADADVFLPGLRRLAAERAPGTLLFAQLLHGGLRVNPEWSGHAHQPVGPSASAGVRELSDHDIADLLDAYVASAQRVVTAGFDGVDIHAAHGYLPAQFLSATENARSDHWGGSFSGRARFTLELVRRMREALPASAVVQLRISAEDMRQSRGIDLDETAELAALAIDAGADVISLSVWDVHLPAQKYPSTTPVEHVRERIGASTPLVAAGKMWNAEDARIAFSQGADLLAIGRSAIFHHNAPHFLRTPGVDPARPPFSRARLNAEGVGDQFVDYLKDKWTDFVLPE